MGRMQNMRRKGAIAFAGVALVAGLMGCDDQPNATNADLVNVPPKVPDNVEAIANIDGHPNFNLVCADGVMFVTTTREMFAFNRLPELDWKCPKPPGFQPYKGEPSNFSGNKTRTVYVQTG
jgi:hypothetical protein